MTRKTSGWQLYHWGIRKGNRKIRERERVEGGDEEKRE